MSISVLIVPIVLAVLKVAVVALIGYGLARRGILHDMALADLSRLVINVTVPCLIFANAAAGFAGLSVPSTLLAIGSAPVVLGLGYLGGLFFGKLLHIEPGHWRPVIAGATFHNSAYLPIAVSTAVLPPLAHLFPHGSITGPGVIAGTSILYISLFGVLYSPIFWGFGLLWLQGGQISGRIWQAAFWTRLLPPPVIGVIIGYAVGLTPLHLLLTPTQAPFHFLFQAISDIGALTITLANLILGGMLAQAVAGRHLRLRDALCVTLAKLIWVPAVGLGLFWLTRHWWEHAVTLAMAAFVVFMQTTTPPATNLAVITKSGGKGMPETTGHVMSGLMLVTYPLAILTMPFWLILFFKILAMR